MYVCVSVVFAQQLSVVQVRGALKPQQRSQGFSTSELVVNHCAHCLRLHQKQSASALVIAHQYTFSLTRGVGGERGRVRRLKSCGSLIWFAVSDAKHCQVMPGTARCMAGVARRCLVHAIRYMFCCSQSNEAD